MALARNIREHPSWIGIGIVVLGLIGWTSAFLDRGGATADEEAQKAVLSLEALALEQHECARSISARSDLFGWSFSADIDTVARAFEVLPTLVCRGGASVELLDARGDLLAWSGRSWHPAKTERTGAPKDSSIRISRSGAFVVLSMTAATGDGEGFVRITLPLSSDNRIIAEVVPRVWGTHADEDIQRTMSVIPLGEGVPIGSSRMLVRTFAGDSLGYIGFRDTNVAPHGAAQGSGLWLMVGTLGLMLLLRHASGSLGIVGSAVFVAGLWALRYGLLWLGLSRDPLFGWLGDPSVYASSFGNGLVASPLDLLLTTGAFLYSLVTLNRWNLRERAIDGIGRSSLAAILFLPFGSILLLLLSRGYAASIRSIIIDTTLRLYDRSSLLPSMESIALLSASLLLTVSLVIIWKFFLEGLSAAAGALGFESGLYNWGSVVILVLIATGAFTVVDAGDVLPPWMPFIGLVVVIPLIIADRRFGDADPRIRLIWAMAIAAFALPTIDWHVHQGQNDEIRRNVEERMSPGDAWLTFLMQSDLGSIAVDEETIRLLSGPREGNGDGTAFDLWSASVMSRQPANSGLVMFDRDGREIDRFVIGFSTYEQDAILRTVFEGAEERIYVVEGGDIGRRIPIYGAWSTVRDPENRVYGTIATILSPSDEQPLYWAVGARDAERRNAYRQAEIVDSLIQRSEIRQLGVGERIDERILRLISDGGRAWAWVRLPGSDGQILFVSDPGWRGRVVATFVPDIDVRWHMFHIAKIVLVYTLLLFAASFVRYVRDRRKGLRTALSFRAKMFAVFMIVSTAPLMMLAIYNDQLSEERTEQQVSRALEQTGSMLVGRMEELFQTDLDVVQGVSNDFCASLAADQGVEFSIYRDIQVIASSRPEVFESGILGTRLDADVFTRMVLQDEEMVIRRQTIGPVSYAVGYFSWMVEGRRAGIIAVPTLFRQGEIEADRAERNAYVLVAYGFALLLVLFLGWFFSDRVTRPLRSLTAAAGALGRGEKVPVLSKGRTDEIGTLEGAFDKMVKELDENRKLLAKVEREQAWREMAKQVAHEIKNPLTPMKLSVQQLLQSFKDKARNREETLWDVTTTLLEQIDTLSRIASEFSHFARLPQGRFEKVDVYRSVREAIGLFSAVPGISFSADIPEGHAQVIADADEVRRVFVNLFRNSIQAMDGEGTITVKALPMDGRVEIRVEDTGPGVPEDLSEKIFEPNFSTKTDGMGLGLAISRKILEDLGGDISVTRLRKGACFTLVFPLQ